jgi:putative quorum-sensing-regulated virulence factor
MTKTELQGYRTAAEKYKNVHRFADMVLELCDEIERLRAVADEKNGRYGDYTLIPFGKYKGRRLMDVPDDYLYWWRHQNRDESSIFLDTQYGPFAQRVAAKMKLKLHEYLKVRLNGNQVSYP